MLGSSLAAPSFAAAPSARWSASAVSSAAWRFEGVSPPSAFAMSSVLKLHALRKGPSSMSSTVALAAAVSAPQPSASKPASTIVFALDAHRDAHKVAAGGTAGGAGVGPAD